MGKSAFIKENTRVLLNKARSTYLKENPKSNKATDNDVINAALKKYIGDENG